MRILQEFLLGIRSFIDANRFIAKHRLWKFLVLPGLLNLLVLTATIILAFYYGSILGDWIFDIMGPSEAETKAVSILRSITGFIFSFLIRVLIFLIYLAIYKYIILIIMSPVLAYLSQKIEVLITGKDYPFDLSQFIKDVGRGIYIALRNLIYELVLTGLFFLLALIPLLGLVSPICIFIVQSYYYGFSMMDYYNERHRLSVKQSVRYISDHRGIAIANGSIFYFLFIIPLIGIIIAPAYTLIAASLALHETENRSAHNGR